MNIFKWIGLTFLFLIFLTFTIWLLFYIQYRQIKPSYPETIESKGILKPASIKIDSMEIPYIFAENEQDLITVMGYYVASQHLWEMELMRRAGKGRLSEIFGESTFEFDLMFRNLQFDSLSIKVYRNISEDSKEWLEWYANGVNLFINQKKDNLPIKFQLMEFQPEEWKARDAVLIYRFISWLATKNWKIDLFYRLASNRLPPLLLKDILLPDDSFIKISKESGYSINQIKKLWEIDTKFRRWWGILPRQYTGIGWVFNGNLLSTGKGILVNKEPFAAELPFNWIEVHLSSPEVNIAGFAMLGIPGVFVGRNKDIAWGITRFPLKETKYYPGTIESGNKSLLIENERLPLVYHKENISIKNREKTFTFLVYKTNHCPILKPAPEDIQTKTVFSLDWTGWYHSDEILFLRQAAKAKNWQEFYNAASHFKIPAEILSFVDNDKNIGLQFATAVPSGATGDKLPLAKRQPQNLRWINFLPYKELPNSFNPEKNWASTSSLADMFSAQILFPSTSSKNQLERFRIKEGKKITPLTIDSLLYIQQDSGNVHLVSSCLKSFNPQDIQVYTNINIEDIIWILSTWDGNINKKSVPAFTFQVWKWFMLNDLFADQMGEELFNHFIQFPELYEPAFEQIVVDKNNPWYDNPETPDVIERQSDIFQNSFKKCIDFLTDELGGIHRWQWRNFEMSKYVQSNMPESFAIFLIQQIPTLKRENKHTYYQGIGLPKKNQAVMETINGCTFFVMDWQQEDGYRSFRGGKLLPGLQVSPVFRKFNTIAKEESKTAVIDKDSNTQLTIEILPE